MEQIFSGKDLPFNDDGHRKWMHQFFLHSLLLLSFSRHFSGFPPSLKLSPSFAPMNFTFQFFFLAAAQLSFLAVVIFLMLDRRNPVPSFLSSLSIAIFFSFSFVLQPSTL